VVPYLTAHRQLLCHDATLRHYGLAVLRAICWFRLLTSIGALLAKRLALSTGLIGLFLFLPGMSRLMLQEPPV
jgi:hypothetical protein